MSPHRIPPAIARAPRRPRPLPLVASLCHGVGGERSGAAEDVAAELIEHVSSAAKVVGEAVPPGTPFVARGLTPEGVHGGVAAGYPLANAQSHTPSVRLRARGHEASFASTLAVSAPAAVRCSSNASHAHVDTDLDPDDYFNNPSISLRLNMMSHCSDGSSETLTGLRDGLQLK